MEVVSDLAACPRPSEGCAVTIGAYDGVHRGHRVVIEGMKEIAASRDLRSAVVTFDRHPARVVRPESAPLVLTDLPQKLELLEDTGLDYAVVLHFDQARSKEPAEQFVREILADCLRSRVVVVGTDFHFGHRRGGDVALLDKMGAELGFEVVGLDLVDVDGRPARSESQVSSTAIRAALADGDVSGAAEMLGRPHEVRGTVVSRDRRAADLGHPTVGIAVPDEVALPAEGVYAGWYEPTGGSVSAAVISHGRRLGLDRDKHDAVLEAHLLDFDGDLSDEVAKVCFVAWLREQRRYQSVDELVERIGHDREEAKAVLGPAPGR